jgi:asparagine synthase (glutamine-hydrolysing)
MCGITGFIQLHPNSVSNPIQEMNDALIHRGPDAGSIFHSEDGRFSLGHRRLSIIDLNESANQPMHSACGEYVIVFNGEVYNYQEVRADLLQEKRIDFRTNGDTEVVMEALIHWGESAVNRFNGMFAFALLHKTNGTLLFGRDRLGKKPLYYFHNESCFAFASELKALLPLTKLFGKFKIDSYGINQFLRLGYIHEPHTIYREIKKLPAASLMRYENHKISIEKYWDFYQKIEKNTLKDEVKAKKQLDELLNSSVQYRLIADVPRGVFLSGGIDSSLVAALAQKHSAEPIKTFSISFKEAQFNESQYAQAVADHLGSDHHTFTVSHQEAIDLLQDFVATYDEPYADASGINMMLVSKLAREHVTMVLTGDGGDEQFLGYGMYTWAQRLSNPVLKTFRKPLAFILSKLGNQRMRRIVPMLNFKAKTHLPSHIFSIEQHLFSENQLPKILNRVEQLNFPEHKTARELTPAETQSFFDIEHYLNGELLVKVDRATMHHSLEARSPLLDYRLLEFSINLDEKLKLNHGTAKYLLKEVLYDYVPKEIFDRPKWGFGLPIRNWLRAEMRPIVEQHLNEKTLADYPFLNAKAIVDLKNQYMAGEYFHFNRVWSLLCLVIWLKKNEAHYEL